MLQITINVIPHDLFAYTKLLFFEQLHFNLHVILCKVCKLYKHNQIEKGNETIQHMLELCYGYPRS